MAFEALEIRRCRYQCGCLCGQRGAANDKPRAVHSVSHEREHQQDINKASNWKPLFFAASLWHLAGAGSDRAKINQSGGFEMAALKPARATGDGASNSYGKPRDIRCVRQRTEGW
ncbi:MAG TPA: hypothetical protein VL051_00375 [Burkholderiaceae bacterium]|nr:hypothetical protein [Burkholderiaceae bacterium]